MPPSEPIVISDSDSDTASESERILTTASSSAPVTTNKPPSPRSKLPAPAPAPAPAAAASLSTLIPDRAQLERERRLRNKKRRIEQGISVSSDEEFEVHTKPEKRFKVGAVPAAAAAASPMSPRPNPSAVRSESRFDSIMAEDRFWKGTVKCSYNRYAASHRQGATVASMLLPATPSASRGLREAVLATYDLNMEWLYPLFPRDVNVTLILNPDKGDHRTDPSITGPGLYSTSAFPAFVRYPGWKICVPNKPKQGWLTQHMKFLFLVHDDFFRVAILSGNLNGFDWDRIENTAFLQDFPLIPAGADLGPSPQRRPGNDFKEQLQRVLKSLTVPRGHAIWAALERFDFRQATARIVASWPEARVLNGWKAIETQGLGRLGKVVRELGIQQQRGGVVLEAQGSSLAKYDRKWLEHFHLLASGVDPREVLPLAGKPNEVHRGYLTALQRKATTDDEQRERDGFDTRGYPPIKVLFPSQRYVETIAVEGPPGAGTFFGKATDFAASEVKHLYHQPRSQRGDVMIHAKSLLAYLPSERATIDEAFKNSSRSDIGGFDSGGRTLAETGKTEAERPIGWTYMGSANFTRAAHGNVGGKAGAATLSTSNWELGVVFALYKSDVEREGVECTALRAVAYERAAPAYSAQDRPWNHSESGCE
ncbi:hypothetical protein ACQY0O_006428 [Thecaphora frezii]